MEDDANREAVMRWGRSAAAVCAAWVSGVLGLASATAFALPTADEARYMSADCARMADAIRSTPRTYAQPRSFQDLRNTYNEQCGLEEARARRQAIDSKRQKWEQEWQTRAEVERQARQAENAAKVLSAQCSEMKQALENRRKRAAANPGEAHDLQMFGQRYQERCG